MDAINQVDKLEGFDEAVKIIDRQVEILLDSEAARKLKDEARKKWPRYNHDSQHTGEAIDFVVYGLRDYIYNYTVIRFGDFGWDYLTARLRSSLHGSLT